MKLFLLIISLLLSSFMPDAIDLKAFQEMLKSRKAVKIICYGDSITFGFVSHSEQKKPKPYPQTLQDLLIEKYKNQRIEVINHGHSGWRTDQAIDQADKIITQKVALIFINFGINDAYSSFTPAYYKKKMTELIKIIKKSKASIVLLSPTPIDTDKNKILKAYIGVLKEVATEQNILFFDLHTAIYSRLDKEKKQLKDILPDNIHFSNQYYGWIAQEIFKFIQNAS